MSTISPFVGKIQCPQCGHIEANGKLMDIDEYGDRTLMWCSSCHKWVRWYFEGSDAWNKDLGN